jgi:hypothetical protein
MSFASRYISEVEGGKGFVGGAKEAAKGTAKDFGKQFSKENIVQNMFGGDDIISAALRNKFGVKGPGKGKKDKTPSPAGGDGQGISSEGISFLKIIAKESMAIPSMARDTNVLRQNLQKLVKIFGGKAATKRDSVEEREKDLSFFAQEDAKEEKKEKYSSEIFTANASGDAMISAKPTSEKKEEKGEGLLDSIMQMFSGGFMEGIKKLFNKKMLMKVFSKVFLPIAIIGTLFSGIMDGFKKYQETGSFSEAIVAGLGGMLNFLTFGLFGEDTLKSLFDSISNFFQPITDTISSIFTGIKDFVKGLFGDKVDVKDDAPAKADDVKPTMPDPKQFAQSMAKASGASDEKSADLGGIFDAVGKGDVGGLFGKAQEFAAKYPEPPPTETSPTPMSSEGVPLDQAQRNYELNKSLTGQASQALGVPLEMPAPPTPATPPAPVSPAPAPAPEMSDADKIKQIEGYIKGNTKRFARREKDAARHIASLKRRYSDQPDKVKEIEDDYKQTLDVERKEMEDANTGFKRQIDFIKKSAGGTVSAGAASSPSPSVSAEGGAESASAVSGGGGGGGGAGGGGGSLSAGGSAPSGSEMSQSSSQVAEGQRMESAADAGSVVNSPTTNNSTAAPDGAKPPVADAYNEEFARLLART